MICFLCGKDGHVSSSCPQRPRLIDRAITVIFAITVTAVIRFGWVRNLVT